MARDYTENDFLITKPHSMLMKSSYKAAQLSPIVTGQNVTVAASLLVQS